MAGLNIVCFRRSRTLIFVIQSLVRNRVFKFHAVT
jgi:hypothetical protein